MLYANETFWWSSIAPTLDATHTTNAETPPHVWAVEDADGETDDADKEESCADATSATELRATHAVNVVCGELGGHGEPLSAIIASMTMITEGVPTTYNAHECGERLGIEVPITTQIRALLDGVQSPLEAMDNLMTRDLPRGVTAQGASGSLRGRDACKAGGSLTPTQRDAATLQSGTTAARERGSSAKVHS